MFGVASNFRKSNGEAAFQALARGAFAQADADDSGCIDTAELQKTLASMGMKLNDQQTAHIITQYDDDNNHELDENEFMKLVSDLIDGTANSKLPLAARKAAEKQEARGVVLSAADLFGSDDDEPAPPKPKPKPKPAAGGGAKPAAKPAAAATKPAAKPAAAATKPAASTAPAPSPREKELAQANTALKAENEQLQSRLKALEAQLAAANGGGGTKAKR